MADLSKLTAGLTGTVSVPVTPERLATVVGSGNAPVFASPMMVAAFEGAAVACVEHLLPKDHQSLGMHLDVTHSAPTPLGLTVVATATLKEISGRKLTFAVTAHDGVETIGSGTHTRVVVDTPRFMARVTAKSRPRP
ncbi:MAG: thioesterase family protein [Hyphomicrobium sp.]|jgi:predicted thioesterase|nr:thioesterase family protein [Hyphomicrobium sp.]